MVVEPGEASKCFPVLASLCERLLELGVERGDCVIAFGGGVVGDLAGFAASILRRGVRVVQMPTTLLAQVDSAIGGKTGIDTKQGKNLIGTFHQPSLVLADIAVLSTLSPREFRAGYAEVVKYGLLGDAPFFAWLEANWSAVFSTAGAERRYAVETSARAKAHIVEADEKEEKGTRALLNLGHTFGHALEAYAGYSDRLLHGEAIAIGMRLAFTFSVELGLCPAERRRPGRAAPRRRRPSGEDRRDPRRHADARGIDAADGARQEGERRQARPGARATASARLSSSHDVSVPRLTEFLTRECATG